MAHSEPRRLAQTSPQTGVQAYYRISEPGMISVSGPDRIDFLQRQTTNDMRLLSIDRPVVTVLTSPTARILDVLTVYELDDNTLGVLTQPGRAAQTTAFLKRRIFFQDNVTVDDESDDIAIIETIGAYGLLDRLNALLSEQAAEYRLILSGDADHSVAQIVTSADAVDTVLGVLDSAGLSQLSNEEAEIIRVEQGRPGPSELTDEYTPLETNFRYAISDDKGCYTGQEVIARQITYDKVTRQLVGLRLDGLAPIGSAVAYQDRRIGTLTSVVDSPHFGPIGLAIIASKNSASGTEVDVRAEDWEQSARITSLPFSG